LARHEVEFDFERVIAVSSKLLRLFPYAYTFGTEVSLSARRPTSRFIAANNRRTFSKGLPVAARSAIQGECSKTLPRAATNSSLLQEFKSERSIEDISSLPLSSH
jgi:hypothetical protein